MEVNIMSDFELLTLMIHIIDLVINLLLEVIRANKK